jgi:predicted nucleic acid-binding protein
MSEQERNIRSFVVDTNLFVAAIKPFSKTSSGNEYKESKALGLLIKLIVSEEFELKGNPILIQEYKRFAEELRSETSKSILRQLIEKTHVIHVSAKSLIECKQFLPPMESADVVHAATCLESGATLITNDKDFHDIGRSGKLSVWSISEAIRKLL